MVSSYNAHFGEEPPISGSMGSGTIFLTHCNLRCVFCQKYPISQLGHGEEVSLERFCLSLMAQYLPAHKACQYPEINRRVNRQEYEQALKAMREAGLERGYCQQL